MIGWSAWRWAALSALAVMAGFGVSVGGFEELELRSFGVPEIPEIPGNLRGRAWRRPTTQ
jgi:hypothetical protein